MKTPFDGRRDFLIGVVPTKRDLAAIVDQGWYRVPVESAPKKHWPPAWVGFYEGKRIGAIRGIWKYARVQAIEERTREQIFPGEPAGPRSGKRYHVLRLGKMNERSVPIAFPRDRRFAFIQTTYSRFRAARTVNDLFADSPLEDLLWGAMKDYQVDAERQWPEQVRRKTYVLDFAIFCNDGKIDVETDGDSYHITIERSPLDNERNNALASRGWRVLRFGSESISGSQNPCPRYSRRFSD